MLRICPKCSNKLEATDYFFCSSCAEILPQNLINTNRSFVRYKSYNLTHNIGMHGYFGPVITRVKETLSPKSLLFLTLTLVVIGLPSYLLYKQGAERLKGLEPEQAKKEILIRNAVKTELVLNKHIFGSDKMWEFIPHDVDVYVEAHDFKALSNLFLSSKADYEELVLWLKNNALDHFSLFVKSNELGSNVTYVFLLRNADLNLDEISTKYNWLNFGIVNNMLVISGKAETVGEIESISKGLDKNIGQNPAFVLETSKSARSGKVLIVVLNQSGKDFLTAYEDLDLSNEINTLISKTIETKNNSVVFD